MSEFATVFDPFPLLLFFGGMVLFCLIALLKSVALVWLFRKGAKALHLHRPPMVLGSAVVFAFYTAVALVFISPLMDGMTEAALLRFEDILDDTAAQPLFMRFVQYGSVLLLLAGLTLLDRRRQLRHAH